VGHDHNPPGIRVTVIGQGQTSMRKCAVLHEYLLWRLISIDSWLHNYFHCEVIRCELARRDVRYGVAELTSGNSEV